MLRSVFITIATSLLFVACTDNKKRISSSEFGEEWPLTVSHGWIECEGDPFIITFESGGHTYGINDAARATEKYEDVSVILRDDPNYPGGHVKMDVSLIEFEGLKLCNHREN